MFAFWSFNTVATGVTNIIIGNTRKSMWPNERYLWIGSSKFSDGQCAGAVMLFCGLERPTPEIAENPRPAWDFATDTRDPRRPGMYSSFLSLTEVPTLHTDPLEIESPTVKSAKAAGLSVPCGPKASISATACVPVGLGQATASTTSASAGSSKIFGCKSLFHYRQGSSA